jgi:hypothetical protein
MNENTKEGQTTEGVESSRRRFLKTAGKIAIYTPPAMLLMSKPSFATFGKSGGYPYPSNGFKKFKKFKFRRFGWKKWGRR